MPSHTARHLNADSAVSKTIEFAGFSASVLMLSVAEIIFSKEQY
jgi:hypothetical protein